MSSDTAASIEVLFEKLKKAVNDESHVANKDKAQHALGLAESFVNAAAVPHKFNITDETRAGISEALLDVIEVVEKYGDKEFNKDMENFNGITLNTIALEYSDAIDSLEAQYNILNFDSHFDFAEVRAISDATDLVETFKENPNASLLVFLSEEINVDAETARIWESAETFQKLISVYADLCKFPNVRCWTVKNTEILQNIFNRVPTLKAYAQARIKTISGLNAAGHALKTLHDMETNHTSMGGVTKPADYSGLILTCNKFQLRGINDKQINKATTKLVRGFYNFMPHIKLRSEKGKAHIKGAKFSKGFMYMGNYDYHAPCDVKVSTKSKVEVSVRLNNTSSSFGYAGMCTLDIAKEFPELDGLGDISVFPVTQTKTFNLELGPGHGKDQSQISGNVSFQAYLHYHRPGNQKYQPGHSTWELMGGEVARDLLSEFTDKLADVTLELVFERVMDLVCESLKAASEGC